MILAISVLLLAAQCMGDGGGHWNYLRTDADYGPDGWNSDPSFPSCAGTSNSPINIVTGDTVAREAAAWDLTGWNTEHTWKVEDSHNGIKYSLEGSNEIVTEGGDLTNRYKVLQFHLHWGANDNRGSEHTVNGEEYPMEVHFVHWNGVYSDANAAIASGDNDALAVLGFFFEIQSEDNPQLDTLLNLITQVRNHQNFTVEGVSIPNLSESVYTAMTGNFYRYMGGLTTPGCNELVRWTVFETPIKISAAQMEAVRTQDAMYATEYGTDFYRPPQALNGRTVTKYDVNFQPSSSTVPKAMLTLSFLSVIVTMLL